MSKKLYEDVKNFLIGLQEAGYTPPSALPPHIRDRIRQDNENKISSFNQSKQEPEPTPEHNSNIRIFAQHINPNEANSFRPKKPNWGNISNIQQQITPTKKENMEHATRVYNAASKFKNDDDAINHLHNSISPNEKLTDEKKNLYSSHINHMRDIIATEPRRRLIK